MRKFLLILATLGSVLLVHSMLGAKVPAGVRKVADVPYVTNGHPRQRLDLYLPEQAGGPPRPVLLWVHGGGWQQGSKEGCPAVPAVLKGYAVASIGYRLTDAAPFPAQIEDCRAAVRFLRAHAAEYGLDPARFAAWGSSAGGHLVALLGTAGDEKSFDVGENLDQSARLQAVVDYFGPTDFPAIATYPEYHPEQRREGAEVKLLGGPIPERLDMARRASPTTYVSADDPPFFIVHGSLDPLVPLRQSTLLYTKLQEAGVPVHLHTVVNGVHGGRGFDTPAIHQMLEDFLVAALKGPAAPRQPKAEQTESNAEDAPPVPARKLPAWSAILRQDANADGQFSRQEFNGPPAVFSRFDKDGDGQVTKEEYEALGGR